MGALINLLNNLNGMLRFAQPVDFLAPLLLRLYLVPVFWMAGTTKINGFENTVIWFDQTLGMPFPWLMAFLAAATEAVGAIFLLFGFATRWISIPLMATMVVAMLTVHLQHGWLAIAAGEGAALRLERARNILQEYGNYEWLTEHGSFVVLNNGIEFAATYLVMLLALFFLGAGRWVSVDYWLARQFQTGVASTTPSSPRRFYGLSKDRT